MNTKNRNSTQMGALQSLIADFGDALALWSLFELDRSAST